MKTSQTSFLYINQATERNVILQRNNLLAKSAYKYCQDLITAAIDGSEQRVFEDYTLTVGELTKKKFHATISHQNNPRNDLVEIAIALDYEGGRKLFPLIQKTPADKKTPETPWIILNYNQKETSHHVDFIEWVHTFAECLAWGFLDWSHID
jgi:hypothetical protein